MDLDATMIWPGKPCPEDALILLPPGYAEWTLAALHHYAIDSGDTQRDYFARMLGQNYLHSYRLAQNTTAATIACAVNCFDWRAAQVGINLPHEFGSWLVRRYSMHLDMVGQRYALPDLPAMAQPVPQQDWFTGEGYRRWWRNRNAPPYIPGYTRPVRRIHLPRI